MGGCMGPLGACTTKPSWGNERRAEGGVEGTCQPPPLPPPPQVMLHHDLAVSRKIQSEIRLMLSFKHRNIVEVRPGGRRVEVWKVSASSWEGLG